MSYKALVNSAGSLLLATVVTGCSSFGKDPVQVGAIPDDYRTRHPIVLSEQEKVLDVPIASDARQLNVPTKSNIRAFSAAFAESGTGVLYLMTPVGSANAAAVSRLQGEIVDAAVAGGARRGSVVVQQYDASLHGPAAPVRLSYRGVEASAGPCGKWIEDITDTSENKNYYDFGCSTQANLAEIVANPGDLLGPRQMSPIDAAERAAVIEDYQSGPVGAASEVNY